MRSLLARLFKRDGNDPHSAVSYNKEKLARFCCHAVSAAEGRVEAFGDSTTTTMPRNADGGFDFCHACLGTMAIQCAWCNRPIFVGDPVTLYMPSDPYIWFSPSVAYMTFDKLEMVGCGRTDCAETGADYAGYWVPSGLRPEGRWIGGVKRMTSIYETVLANNRSVVADDLSSMAGKPLLPGVQVPERMPAV